MNKLTGILTFAVAALAAAPVAEARHHDGGYGGGRGYSERGGCSRRYVEYCRSCGGPAYIETYVAFYNDCGDPVFRTRVIPVEVYRPAPVYCPPPVVVRERDCGPRITVQFGGWR